MHDQDPADLGVCVFEFHIRAGRGTCEGDGHIGKHLAEVVDFLFVVPDHVHVSGFHEFVHLFDFPLPGLDVLPVLLGREFPVFAPLLQHFELELTAVLLECVQLLGAEILVFLFLSSSVFIGNPHPGQCLGSPGPLLRLI